MTVSPLLADESTAEEAEETLRDKAPTRNAEDDHGYERRYCHAQAELLKKRAGADKPRRQELLSVERLLYARAVLLLLPKAKATTRLRTPSARWMRLSATL